MPKSSPAQASFNSGEYSPLMYGRFDQEAYASALKLCLNAFPLVQGPWMRRSGTYYVAEVKDSSTKTRIINFEFNTQQAYIIELGDKYMRFYKDHGQITSGGGPYEISTPYAAADIFDIQFVQSADVVYLVHPSYEPRKLTRTGHTNWTLKKIEFQDGPYLDTNATATTLVSSVGTGSGTLTASAVTGINDDAGFQSTDVGRLVRLKNGSNWAWVEITGYTSTTQVSIDVKGGTAPTTPTTEWRLGLWSGTTGYPATVTFSQDRLCFGGVTNYPTNIDESNSGDYENMAPTDADGTVTDSHAISAALNANNVNLIRWILDDEKGQLVGTTGGEWVIRPSSLGEALTPTNINASKISSKGSAPGAALKVSRNAVFVQRAQRKVYSMGYMFDVDGFKPKDITRRAEHITYGGISQLTYQQEPFGIIWGVRADGTLIGTTYDPEENVNGWHRHVLGGQSDASGTQAKVESIAVIPTPDGSSEELWLVVQRYVNGSTKRYVEYMQQPWIQGGDVKDAFYVDSGLTYSGSATTTISGLDHLVGETVGVLTDGAAHPDKTVDAAGSITLDWSASKVHVGLKFKSAGQLMNIEAGAADGVAQGKIQRITHVTFRFYDTVGLDYGADTSNLDTLPFREVEDNTGEAIPLFNGDKTVPWPGGYEQGATLYWETNIPLPCCISAIMLQLTTQDR